MSNKPATHVHGTARAGQPEHTPGPWVENWLRVFAGDRCLAHGVYETYEGYTAEERANVLVMAAGPDMLAALHGVLAAATVEMPAAVLAACEAAIAKAEGRE